MDCFVAFDFETANSNRASACSLGMVRMSPQGEVLDTFYSLIRPHEALRTFEPINISVHSITADQVADAPSWSDIFHSVEHFIGDTPIVAHNMAFDGYILSDLATLYGFHDFYNRRFCTLRLAKHRSLPSFPAHDLDYLHNYYFPGDLFTHHHAYDDALACGRIFSRMIADYGWNNLEQWCRPTGPGTVDFERNRKTYDAIVSGHSVSRKASSSRRVKDVSGNPLESSCAVSSRAIDPSQQGALNHAQQGGQFTKYSSADMWREAYPHCVCQSLAGEQVVITGTLSSCTTKNVAHSIISMLGGTTSGSLSRKTTILVVGGVSRDVLAQEIASDVKGTGKRAKAVALREAGHPIRIMSEEEFFSYIQQ